MSTRACKVGDAFKTEQKMEKKYDEEEKLGTPKRLMAWINKVIEGEEQPCNGHSHSEIHKHLKSGVVLCRLLNKLLTDNGDAGFSYRAKASTAFVAMENISKFNKAALVYGVPDTALFQTSDLYEGRKGPMINVINCLNTLGFMANDKGFMPDYEAIKAPKPDWAGDSD